MSDSSIASSTPTAEAAVPCRRNRWLVLISAFKLLQAMLFLAIGVGAMHLLHKDVADQLARLADHLRVNPESRLVNIVLENAALLNDRLLVRIGAVVFIYAALDLFEGIGLFFEKLWAEYLTLAITTSFLPWEMIEIGHRPSWWSISLLVINLLVCLYLLRLTLNRRQLEKAAQALCPTAARR